MPPRELPGFYFDTERNRYFPLSSRPPPTSSASTSTSQPASEAQEHAPPTRRRRQLWSCAGGTTAAGRAREAQRLLHTRFAATQRCYAEQVRWPFYGTASNTLLCAFRTTPTRQFLGDELGWLYSRGRAEASPLHSQDADESLREEWGEWTPELCLAPDSQISAICTTSTRCVAVCFGPSTKICVQDAGMPERTALLHLSDVFDVRAASLQGSTLVLGALRQAVLLPDIDVSAGVRKLPTRTDVFSVAQQENLVYTGTRAGAVLRFDTRTSKNNGQVLFESGLNNNTGPGLSGPIQRSSVVFLQPTHGRQALVAGCMDGRLAAFDLRFVRPAAPPVVTYAGNPSSVSHSGGLGFAIDPAERFLFAAGADARLRGWALDSGVPILPDAAASTISYTRPSDPKAPCNPFATRFAAPLSALQVVEDGQGDVLWASGGGVVLHWRLGV